MKKLLTILLSLCLTGALLTGCSQEPTADPPASPSSASSPVTEQKSARKLSVPDGESWTILVYLCGTDLESQGGFASINIQEMAAATENENVNVLFQTGGTKEWSIDSIDPTSLGRYRVTQGDITLEESQPLASMGEADTLGSFLKWGVETYPADKYACILWNHGGGSINGIAFDELHSMDSLDLNELSNGLSQAGVQFELIGFDACLMATLETAASLAPYGRYMIASQEVEPGTGWDYTSMLNSLGENPKQTGLDWGKTICDGFYAKCAATGSEGLATLSVTELAQVPALVNQFDRMAAEMKGFTAVPEKLQPLTQAMFRAENYGGNNDNEGYTNMVDLGDWTQCAEGVVSETGTALLESLKNAVPYAVEGSSRQRSNGLSVYVPLSIGEGELDKYAPFSVSGEYLRFFEGLYDWTVPAGTVINQPSLPESLPSETTEPQPDVTEIPMDSLDAAETLNREDYKVAISTELSDNGYVTLHINQGAEVIQNVAYNLYYLDEESESLLFLGSDYDLNSEETGTKYWDNFRNVWPTINGETCSMLPLEWGEDYILYTVPIRLNGIDTNLRMTYHYANASYEVIGSWDGIDSDTGMSSREVRKLKNGDKVEFVFNAFYLDSGEAYQFTYGGFTVDGDVVVEEANLFDAEFYYQYEVTDLFGESYTSDFAIIKSKNGEITVEMEQ